MRKRGFTLVEILIVLGILAILASVLLPAFNRVRSNARATSCASNLRQIGLAVRLYLGDNNGYYFDPNYFGFGLACSWPDRINPYVRSPAIFQCPEAPELVYAPGCAPDDRSGDTPVTFNGGYDLNDVRTPPSRLSEGSLRDPSNTIIVLDGTGERRRFIPLRTPDDVLHVRIPLRHHNGANVLYADSHIKWLSLDSMARPGQWTPEPTD